MLGLSGTVMTPQPPLPPTPRASDAERRQASERLQAACVDGYLTLDEFSQRVERAMVAQTRVELSRLLADLPAAAAPRPLPPATTRTLVVLSAVERSGDVRLAEHSRVVIAAGSCKLDLRRASIAARLTAIEVQVVFGALEVIVPSGVEVDVEAVTVLGHKTVRLRGPAPVADAPRIVIHGLVFAGALTVRDQVRPLLGLA